MWRISLLVHIDLLWSRREAVQVACISDDFSIKHANPTVHPPVSLALYLQNSVTNDDTSSQKNRNIFCRMWDF